MTHRIHIKVLENEITDGTPVEHFLARFFAYGLGRDCANYRYWDRKDFIEAWHPQLTNVPNPLLGGCCIEYKKVKLQILNLVELDMFRVTNHGYHDQILLNIFS